MKKQPKPTQGRGPAIWSLVIADAHKRDLLGIKRYGKRLRAFNTRNSLRDAYEEAMDLCAYLRQRLYEEEGR